MKKTKQVWKADKKRWGKYVKVRDYKAEEDARAEQTEQDRCIEEHYVNTPYPLHYVKTN